MLGRPARSFDCACFARSAQDDKPGRARSRVVLAEAGKRPIVGIIMGSSSDWETMSAARDTLAELDIPCEMRVVSAHRMPDEMFEYAASAAEARACR